MNAEDAGDPLIAELANAVEKARAEFGGDRSDWHPSQWLDELLSMVRRTDDWKGLADSVSAQLQRIETWRTQVQEFLNQTVATVAERERRERYTGGWWQRKLRLIREAFQVIVQRRELFLEPVQNRVRGCERMQGRGGLRRCWCGRGRDDDRSWGRGCLLAVDQPAKPLEQVWSLVRLVERGMGL